MRFATTIFLTVAAVGLGIYAFLDHSGIIREFFGESGRPALVAPVTTAITSFNLERGDEARTLELQSDGSWRLTSPIDDLADPAWVQKALETFGTLQAKDFLRDEDGAGRSGYGLSTETATTLRIGLSDGKSLVYQVGQKGPFANSSYLFPGPASDYEGAFAVSGDFAAIADTPVSKIIDPVLTRFDQEKIVGLTFQHEDDVIDLKRPQTPGGRWRLENPIQLQADDDQVNTLLTALTTIPVSQVTLDPGTLPETATANSKKRIIQIWDPVPKNVIELTLTPHPSDETLLRTQHSQRSLVYDVPKTVLDDIFPKDAEALRESRLLRVLAADINSVSITPREGNPLLLENTGAWLMTNKPDEGAVLANPEQGERFLTLLNETLVLQYLQSGPDKLALYGLDTPQFVVEMQGENLGPLQTETLTMSVGLPPGNPPNVYVTFKDTDFIAAVSKTFLTGLIQSADPISWKKLEVLNIAFNLINEVTMEVPGADTVKLKVDYEAEEEDQRLRVEQNGADRTDDMNKLAAGQMIMNVGTLSPDRWIHVSTESVLALTNPSLLLTVKSGDSEDAEAKTWTVKFAPVNAEVPAFYYGQLEGTSRPEPFLISRDSYDRLSGKGLILEAP